MIPPLLVSRCQEQALNLVGVVDHNSAANAWAVVEAARDTGIVVKPGLEVESRETVHFVCLFDTIEQALDLQGLVYAHLPSLAFAPGASGFGGQFLVDPEGRFLGHEERALFAATDLSAEHVVEEAKRRGALVLAAHAERRAHGLLAVLGFVPPGLALDGLESGPGGLSPGRTASSDAHRLAEVGSRYTVFQATGVSVEELRATLARGDFRAGLAI